MSKAQQELFDDPQAKPSAPKAAPPKPAPKPPEPEKPALEGPPTLTMVDASGFIFRAYHALPPLTTSKGVPTNAVLGFARMLLKLMRERQPTHLVLCFDKDSRKGRQAIDPQYKANRSATPEDLVQQLSLIRRVAEVLRLPIVEVPGWEADDVAATLVKQARAHGFHTEIVTSDKDFLQLLADDVRLYDPGKDKDITEKDALEKFGVTPAQMRDYQSLVGDAVDNVPKVPGVGPKTAADLLKKFGDLDTLLARVSEVDKPKIRAAIESHREQVLRARELVRFRDDLPVEADVGGFALKPIDEPEAKKLFTELEFYRLLDEMPKTAAVPEPEIAAQLVDDAAALEALAAALAKVEAVGVMPLYAGEAHSARPLGLAVSAGETVAFVDLRALPKDAVAKVLGPALSRKGLALETHDGKALLHVLWALGLDAAKVATDVELLSWLLNASRKEHSLFDLSRELLHRELPPWPEGPRGKKQVAPEELSPAQAGPLMGSQARAAAALAPKLWQEVDGVGLGPIAREPETPLMPVLARMERAGLLVDQAALARIAKEVDASCETLLKKVYEHAGHELNVGSPQQLAQVLFDELKLPVLKKGKTGPSTDHEVLEKLAEQHPLPGAIIEYRNVSKLKSTYLDALPPLIGSDGRVRTTLHQAAAATGRLSSTNPNLQNIPIRTELGKQIRRVFVAPEGHVLVSADYSQIELRILAHVSEDQGLIDAFKGATDVHARTAAEVYGVPEAEVTADMRRVAKMVNYGIAYGLSAFGLAARLNLPKEEAAGIIDRYFTRYQGIAHYLEETLEQARKRGYVETLFGRRRYMPDLRSKNRSVVMAAERAAINMPIQGTAADLIKRAMLKLDQALPEGGPLGRMLLQVHDELLFEVPTEKAKEVAELARSVMSSAADLKVPLVVDVGTGHSWADAH